MPLPGRGLTSVLVRREGDLLLFDCGEATQIAFRRLNLRWKKISHIFISHTHADHVTGLPGMLSLSSQVERSEPLHVYGPPRGAPTSSRACGCSTSTSTTKIVIHETLDSGPLVAADGFHVHAYRLRHSKPVSRLHAGGGCAAWSVPSRARRGSGRATRAALGTAAGRLLRNPGGWPHRGVGPRDGGKATRAQVRVRDRHRNGTRPGQLRGGRRPDDLRGHVLSGSTGERPRQETSHRTSSRRAGPSRRGRAHGPHPLQPPTRSAI